MLTAVHDAVSSNRAIPAWPDVIPAQHRKVLGPRWGLRDKFIAYADSYAALNTAEQQLLAEALIEQNRIAQLVAGLTTCRSLGDLAKEILDPIEDLFGAAFTALTPLGIRDRQYALIYESMPSTECPFCGSELFDAPDRTREALDHYLARELYPFAGVNLRNLVPMGNKCNSRHKVAKDILHGIGGRQRRSLDPYGDVTITVHLTRSRPFEGEGGKLPAWVIDFVPDDEATETWNTIFNIKDRYEHDLLNARFDGWLRLFAGGCIAANTDVASDNALTIALSQHIDTLRFEPMQDQNFLRAEVFSLFRQHIQADDPRVAPFLRSYVDDLRASRQP